MIICPKCSMRCKDNDRYCPNCHTSLSNPDKSTPQESPAHKNQPEPARASAWDEHERELLESILERSRTEFRLLQIRREENRKQKMEQLRQQGVTGYYEYAAYNVRSQNSGSAIDIEVMLEILNSMGERGWKLLTTVSSQSGGIGVGASFLGIPVGLGKLFGQSVLIFERYVTVPPEPEE